MNEFEFEDGVWMEGVPELDKDGNESIVWYRVPITEVPLTVLLQEYEDLVLELGKKEVELGKVKEEYTTKEFEIVFKSDIDFKKLYGSTQEKVRKQHAKEVLSDLSKKKADLQLSVDFIREYIPLLKEVIRSKQ